MIVHELRVLVIICSFQSAQFLQVCKCGFCYHIEVLKVCILQVCKSDATGRRQVKCGLCIDVFILKR